MADARDPLEGQILLLAGAQASVNVRHLPELAERAQGYVRERVPEYERQFERIDGVRGASYYLVEQGHWETIEEELGFDCREADAVRRAHIEQFRREGRRLDRLEEFETSIEIREIVAVGGATTDGG